MTTEKAIELAVEYTRRDDYDTSPDGIIEIKNAYFLSEEEYKKWLEEDGAGVGSVKYHKKIHKLILKYNLADNKDFWHIFMLYGTPYTFKNASDNLKNDQEYVIKEIDFYGAVILEVLDEEQKCDKEYMLNIYRSLPEHRPYILNRVSDKLKKDKEFMEEIEKIDNTKK